jgi:hypothetical protein
MGQMKLVKIVPSTDTVYKYDAHFDVEGKEHVVKFGANGYKDYILYNKEESPLFADKRKELYILRHKMKEDWTDPTSKGALSRYVLWNKRTLDASIADYKKHFGL